MPPRTSNRAGPDAAGTLPSCTPNGATPNVNGTLCPGTSTGPTTTRPRAEGAESVPTGQVLWELRDEELDDAILNLMPGEEDDFDGVNLDFAAALLENDREETSEHIANACNPKVKANPEGQDYPELKLGVSGLDLGGESDSNLEEPSKLESASDDVPGPAETPANDSAPPSEDVEMIKQGEPLPPQPGLEICDRQIHIRGVGLFRHRPGQPISLRAYPWVELPAVPLVEGKPQAYSRQDRHDPTGLYPHSTRKEKAG